MNIIELLKKYRNVISYLFFGGCTTLFNIIAYWICTRFLQFPTGISTAIAWLLAVVFAFFTNKAWVFESKSWNRKIVIKELLSFFACRVATGCLDLMIMLVTVDIFHWNDIIMKTASNILVIVLNYIASKMIIFKKRG